ncbi:MAG: Ig-like domain-containing protein [Lachnospiraceae bacterium]|nr:Ig-like domain-containing protein [Lachnospiraceae bacterium]
MKKRLCSLLLMLVLVLSCTYEMPVALSTDEVHASTQKLQFNTKKLTLRAGCRAQIYAYGWYTGRIKYYSTNSEVVTISKNCVVKAKNKGTATLIVEDTGNGHKSKCKVTVKKKLTSSQVRSKLYELKESYPEGKHWTNNNKDKYGNGGCYAFMTIAQEYVFGKEVMRKQHTSFKKIKVGDHIRIGNYHSVVVLKKKENSVIVVEGNYNSSIHWGREITKAELNKTGFYVDTCVW